MSSPNLSQSMDRDWPILLFNRSVLKQRKYQEIVRLLGPTIEKECLDIGSDNGVISLLLRGRGGVWKSADLDAQTVETIRELVHEHVYQIDGLNTSFKDNEFDRVIIIDFLEHIHTDREFVAELFRVMKPGGELILNVPHIKNTLLRRLRIAMGQTDEKHGHLRPGYTIRDLSVLLNGRFEIVSYRTYSKFFSEFIDTCMNFSLSLLKKEDPDSRKGMVVTGGDLKKARRMFYLYSLIYPVVWIFSKLDHLLFFSSGYMLIAKARIEKSSMNP